VRLKPALTNQQQEARARTAVAEFLFRQLIVPKVFVEAHWPNERSRVDVLAVDRSGAGEVHVVEVKLGEQVWTFEEIASSLMHIPAHFKYLALFENHSRTLNESSLYAPTGMGRVGVIQVIENETGDLSVELRVRPERFRFESNFKLVDRFTAAHQPDIEIRP